ncbi:MAG: chemotaxis protein CheA [Bacteroidales bacterium]|nr:chemotaxis protein CheA [Candidatus Latescibacterota bacterium]
MRTSSSALIITYLEDTDEMLSQMEEILVEIEKHPRNIELLNTLFRVIHTIKGSSSFMGFSQISSFAHELENLLHSVRSGEIEISDDAMDAIFKSHNIFRILLDDIRDGGEEKGRDLREITAIIQESMKNIDARSVKSEKSDNREKAATRSVAPPISPTGDEKEMAASRIGIGKVSDIMLLSMLSRTEVDEILDSPENLSLYHLNLEFQLESSMPVARAMMVIRELDLNTRLLVSVPPIEYLEEEFDGRIDMLVLAEQNKSSMRGFVEGAKGRSAKIHRIDREGLAELFQNDGINEDRPFINEEDHEKADRENNNIDDKDSTVAGDQPPLIEPEIVMTGLPVSGSDQDHEASATKDPESRPAQARSENVDTQRRKEFIKVDIQKLDILMNLVGELVTNRTRNHDLIMRARLENEESENLDSLFESMQEQGRVINEIQESIMKSRLVPVGSIFNSVPLVVREIARETGKLVDCRISGESTELDKKLVDGIREAIMHLVRNSVDHGIEAPEERGKAGKPEKGVLEVSAFQEYDQIVIKIQDDGRGIDTKKLTAKALEKGVVTPGEIIGMNEAQLLALIFRPGLSTSETVTTRSGRGVGMDVVKREVEMLSGAVDIASKPGMGTLVTMRVPITLAIIQGLLVRSGDRVFAIPISNVSEIRLIDRTDIHPGHGGSILYKMREEIIELHTLEKLLGMDGEEPGETFHVVVINNFGKLTGIIVDGLVGEREIVIKNIKNEFLNVDGVAGASIMGDGRVILIIDISELLRKRGANKRQIETNLLSGELAGV